MIGHGLLGPLDAAQRLGLYADVAGHAQVISLLVGEAARPAQSYLFVGPGSVGKATVARRFAASLLCDDASCARRVLAATHPDLVLVEPDGRSAITVDQARHAVSQASLAPLESARKVFLFEDGGLMNDEAANALLKTLEEPTQSTTFILLAESEDDLPATIASRCRTVVFGRVAEPDVRAALVRHGLDEDQAAQVARISGGRPGLALALGTRPEVAAFRRLWLEIPLQAPDHPGDAFRLAERVIAATEPLLAGLRERQATEVDAALEGSASRGIRERHERELRRATAALYVTGLEILAGYYRDAAAAQFGAPVRNTDIPAGALTKVLPARALACADRVLETIDVLQANQRPRLALAALFADLGGDS